MLPYGGDPTTMICYLAATSGRTTPGSDELLDLGIYDPDDLDALLTHSREGLAEYVD